MSNPSQSKSLHAVLNELTSGRSALHMQDENGVWLDSKFKMVEHSIEHFQQASTTLRTVMQNYDEILSNMYNFATQKQMPDDFVECIVQMKNLLI